MLSKVSFLVPQGQSWTTCVLCQTTRVGSTTHQFGFELVLTVPVAQPAVAALAPGVELSAGRDAGAVRSPGRNVHHLYAPQGLDHPRSITRAGGEDETGTSRGQISDS